MRPDQQATLGLKRRVRASRGMFHHDAARYLKTIAALPTLADRTRESDCWIDLFEDRQRDRITSADIRAARDRWLTEPRATRTHFRSPRPR